VSCLGLGPEGGPQNFFRSEVLGIGMSALLSPGTLEVVVLLIFPGSHGTGQADSQRPQNVDGEHQEGYRKSLCQWMPADAMMVGMAQKLLHAHSHTLETGAIFGFSSHPW
jgi:hypothetical protein